MAVANNADGTCKTYLSGSSPIKNAEMSYFAPSDTNLLGYVQLNYTGGAPNCASDPSQSYSITININCNNATDALLFSNP
jgi:hypothetical protein